MILSEYQSAILKWVKEGRGHGCCNAVAGSGKTTTLRLVAIALQEAGISPHDIKVVVFNKANKDDLVAKFGPDWKQSIATLNSVGWGMLRRHLELKTAPIETSKYRKIAREMGLIKGSHGPRTLAQDRVVESDDDFLRICDLVRQTNVNGEAEEIMDICSHFEIPGVSSYSHVSQCVKQVLREGEAQARAKKSFDYIDQIWLPVRWGLSEASPYKFVLVDECQDLNALQLELSLGLAGKKGRILAVGDPRQAIYGFAGADCNSFQNIVTRLKAKELPLSLCYRCPKSHIELVNDIFPQIPIKATPEAIGGSVERIKETDLWGNKDCRLKEGDMVLCRKTAPLVNLCLKLIARGIAATVRGREIGKQIKAELEAIAKIPGFSYAKFNDAVARYSEAKCAKYKGLDNEDYLVEVLTDKIDALLTIYRSQPMAKSINDLGNYIDSLFSDEHSPVTLCTAHRAKGLEGDRIFLLKPGDMPMVWRGQQEWQKEQENNLLYVSLTRSKSQLFIIGTPQWLQREKEGDRVGTTSDDGWVEIQAVSLPTAEPAPIHEGTGEDLVASALLADPSRSDRAIATELGVAASTVGRKRKKLEAAGLIESIEKRIGRNGRQLKTTLIGTPKPSPTEQIARIAAGWGEDEIKEAIRYLRSRIK